MTLLLLESRRKVFLYDLSDKYIRMLYEDKSPESIDIEKLPRNESHMFRVELLGDLSNVNKLLITFCYAKSITDKISKSDTTTCQALLRARGGRLTDEYFKEVLSSTTLNVKVLSKYTVELVQAIKGVVQKHNNNVTKFKDELLKLCVIKDTLSDKELDTAILVQLRYLLKSMYSSIKIIDILVNEYGDRSNRVLDYLRSLLPEDEYGFRPSVRIDRVDPELDLSRDYTANDIREDSSSIGRVREKLGVYGYANEVSRLIERYVEFTYNYGMPEYWYYNSKYANTIDHSALTFDIESGKYKTYEDDSNRVDDTSRHAMTTYEKLI